jgi:acetyl esterase/lipase
MSVQILIEPKTSLVDEKIEIKLIGLAPNQLVTLRAKMTEMPGAIFEAVSHATFLTDLNGEVQLSRQAPISGTYSGIDSMGLFWSMNTSKVSFNLTRNLEELLFTPSETGIVLSVEIDNELITESTLYRKYVSPNVAIVDVKENGLVGKYFYPKQSEPAPCMIVLGGGEGGLGSQMNYAALFASHGFPSLALAYFRFEHLPEQLREIPLEYFNSAIQWLQNREEVNSDKIGIFGRSKGAELSLLLGSIYPQIKAIIASSPSSTVCIGSIEKVSEIEFATFSSWSYKGTPLPYVKWTNEQCAEALTCFKTGERIDAIHRASLEQCDILDEVTIPVENITGSIMLITSSDDHWWPSGLYGERICTRLKEKCFPNHIEHLHYVDTGHMIRYPYIPTTNLRMNGGTVANNAYAASDSWKRIKTFLRKAFYL